MNTVQNVTSYAGSAVGAQSANQNPSVSAEINKNEFLKLFIAQLKNQDPMNPVDNQQFITQLATFSSLEQLISINTAVTKLANESTPSS